MGAPKNFVLRAPKGLIRLCTTPPTTIESWALSNPAPRAHNARPLDLMLKVVRFSAHAPRTRRLPYRLQN